jgi:hypothetical protein
LIRLGRAAEARPFFEQVLANKGFDNANTEMTPALWMSKKGITPTSLTSIIPATITLDFMEKELRREFLFEDHRRTDMIRFGKYLGTWGLKNEPSQSFRKLFPIPNSVLRNYTQLKQNPGY